MKRPLNTCSFAPCFTFSWRTPTSSTCLRPSSSCFSGRRSRTAHETDPGGVALHDEAGRDGSPTAHGAYGALYNEAMYSFPWLNWKMRRVRRKFLKHAVLLSF